MENEARANRRRRLPRIRRWYGKLAYVVVAILIVYLIALLVADPSAAGNDARGILRSVVAFLLALLATRVFRGVDEDVDAPRPAWRMTGGILAGFVLGVLLALVAIADALETIGLVSGSLAGPGVADPLVPIVMAVLAGVLAYRYLASSLRLRRAQRLALLAQSRPTGPSTHRPGGRP
ncbi:MAG: hypothetical protein WDM88_02070 [Galbitalea sp.]